MSLMPFGRDVVSHSELTGKSNMGWGTFRFVANLIWLPFGAMLAISHVIHGCLMFITIIGIPLALQDFKLAGISLFPVGKRVVTVELKKAALAANAQQKLAALRS